MNPPAATITMSLTIHMYIPLQCTPSPIRSKSGKKVLGTRAKVVITEKKQDAYTSLVKMFNRADLRDQTRGGRVACMDHHDENKHTDFTIATSPTTAFRRFLQQDQVAVCCDAEVLVQIH